MAGSKWRALCPETPASVMPPTCLCHSDVPLLLPPKSETRACPVISGAGLLRQPHGCAGLTPDPKQVAFPGALWAAPLFRAHFRPERRAHSCGWSFCSGCLCLCLVVMGEGERGFPLHQTRKLRSPVTCIGRDKWTLACCSSHQGL